MIKTFVDRATEALFRTGKAKRVPVDEARRALTPEMALWLGKLFGNSPELRLNLQRNVDLWDAARG